MTDHSLTMLALVYFGRHFHDAENPETILDAGI